MRILFFSNVFPNHLQPTKGTFNRSMVAALSQNHSVRVVSPISWIDSLVGLVRNRSTGSIPRSSFVDRVHADYPLFFYPPKIVRHQYHEFLWWSVGHAVMTAAQEFQPDVMLSYWPHPDGAVAIRAARRLGIPVVITSGGSDVLLLSRDAKRREAIFRALAQADAVVAVSHDIAQHLRNGGLDPDRIHVVHMGVDRDVFRPGDQKQARELLGIPGNRLVLLAVGRLVPVKGYEVLIEACRHLATKGGEFTCYVLGDGQLRSELQRKIDDCGLRQYVRLMGAQPQEELADWYRAADLTVLSSHSEGIPNVLKESISCGTPFVATRVGGIEEIADPTFDRLVTAGDPVGFAAAIEEQLKRIPITTTLQRRYEPVSWEDASKNLLRVIEDCRHDQTFVQTPERVLTTATHE